MKVSVEAAPRASTTPTVRVMVEPFDLDDVVAGFSLRFEVDLPEGRRCIELLREDAEPSPRPSDYRLRLPLDALNGVRAGGRLIPAFDNIPFVLLLESTPALSITSPVLIAPNVVAHPIDLRTNDTA